MEDTKLIKKLEDRIDKLEKLVESYQRGDPGVTRGRLQFADGEYITLGNFHIDNELQIISNQQVDRGLLVTGSDLNAKDGSENMLIVQEHQPGSTSNGSAIGLTNLSFVYAYRAPLYTGTDGTITTGGSTLQTIRYKFTENELTNALLLVGSTPTSFNTDTVVHTIASNTVDTITASGASWAFTSKTAYWSVFVPVYLGSANYPWQRAYVARGTAGGVRFGEGPTGGGQNGLLYMDSAGDIYWRNLSGTSTKLN